MAIVGTFMTPHPPLIIPEVGRGQEAAIEETIEAYREAARRVARLRPETILVTTPHSVMYADYFHISPGTGAKGDFRDFGAGSVTVEAKYDREFVECLCRIAEENHLKAGTLGERERRLDHAVMIPLYFVNQVFSDYRLVRIGLSGLPLLDHYILGQCIQEAALKLQRRVVLIASGDLSHRLKEDGPYGYREEGPVYDKRIMEVMGTGNFGELFEFSDEFCEKAGECGHRSFVIMAGALDRTAVRPQKLSYEGPFGVGYGVCSYEILGPDAHRDFGDQFEERENLKARERKALEDSYVKLARKTVEAYVRTGKRLELSGDIPEEMLEKQAGVFVSIKKDGRLRGCIGTISATQPDIAREIVQNAISAASADPRFQPIAQEELSRLVYSVDVLGEAVSVESEEELDPLRYGVIVTKGGRRGLLLPNLEGVDTAKEQIAIARQKAGIREGETVKLERFEVVRHK